MPTSVSGISSTQTGVSSASVTGSSAMGKDEFLKLLLAQLGRATVRAHGERRQGVGPR